jgi:hypothetical protein
MKNKFSDAIQETLHNESLMKAVKSATTKRTCDTCGALRAGCVGSEKGTCPNWGPWPGIEPRPAAQDADECRKAYEDYLESGADATDALFARKMELTTCGTYLQAEGFHAAWNRRPSLPMSAEVDDGILWQEIYSLREKLKIAVDALKSDNPDFDDHEFTHRLNSVDFDQLMEELAGSTPNPMSAEVEKAERHIENAKKHLAELHAEHEEDCQACKVLNSLELALAALKEKV